MNQTVHAFNNQITDMLKDGRVQIPGPVKEVIEASIENTRAQWESTSTTLKSLSERQLSTAKSVGDHVIQSMSENFDCTTRAVLSLTKARSFAEAQRIQMEFLSETAERAMAQSNALLSLTTKAFADVSQLLPSTVPTFAKLR